MTWAHVEEFFRNRNFLAWRTVLTRCTIFLARTVRARLAGGTEALAFPSLGGDGFRLLGLEDVERCGFVGLQAFGGIDALGRHVGGGVGLFIFGDRGGCRVV